MTTSHEIIHKTSIIKKCIFLISIIILLVSVLVPVHPFILHHYHHLTATSNNNYYLLHSSSLSNSCKKNVKPLSSLSSSSIDTETHNPIIIQIDENDHSHILASLFGSTKACNDFFQNDFGKNVIHIKREDCQLLKSPFDMDIQNGGIQIEKLLETNKYIAMRHRGSFQYLQETNITSLSSLQQYMDDGGSIVIPIIDNDYLFPIKQQLELGLGKDISMNIYHSGHNAVALNRHYDTYDVFVVHIQGEKEWEVKWDNQVWKNITLVPGDMLYMPKGIWHAATTKNGFDSTTHITLGLTEE